MMNISSSGASNASSGSASYESPWILLADVHFNHPDLARVIKSMDWVVNELTTKHPHVRHIFILGDTSHARSQFAHASVPTAIASFFRSLVNLPSKPLIHGLIGNHDLFNLSDRSATSLDVFDIQSDQQIRIYREPTMMQVDGQPVLMMPYFHKQMEIVEYIDKLKQSSPIELEEIILMGHMAINGAQINGSCDHSNQTFKGGDISVKMLTCFKRVFTGHFHRHATYENKVTYVGSPMQQNFGDVDDDARGMILYHPRRDEFRLAKNPHAVHFLSDSLSTLSMLDDSPDVFAQAKYAGKCVRIVVPARYDTQLLADVVWKLTQIYKVKGWKKHQPHLPPPLLSHLIPSNDNDDEADADADADDDHIKIQSEEKEQGDNILGGHEESRDQVEEYAFDMNRLVEPFVDFARSNELLKSAMSDSIEDRNAKIELMHSIISKVDNKRSDMGVQGVGDAAKHYFDGEIQTIEIQNFMGIFGRRLIHMHVMPDGAWYVTGTNGTGKSSLLEAITWCLWGETLRGDMKAGDTINDRAKEPSSKDNVCKVKLIFKNGYMIERDRKENRKDATHLKIIEPDGTVIEKAKLKDTQAEIETLLGIDYDTYARTAALSSTTTLNFINSDDKSKRMIIERLLGCEKFADYDDAVKEEKKVREQEYKKFEEDLYQIAHKKKIRENDIINCSERIRVKLTETEALKQANVKTQQRLVELTQQYSVLQDQRNDTLAQIDKLQHDREALDAQISEGNKTCSELQELAQLVRQRDHATNQVTHLQSTLKLIEEKLRMQQEKGSLERIVDAVYDIRETSLKKIALNQYVVDVANRLADEVAIPLQEYIQSTNHTGHHHHDDVNKKKLLDIKNLQMKQRTTEQQLEAAIKEASLKSSLLEQFLEMRGWSTATYESKLATLSEHQNRVGQASRRKERIDQDIKTTRSNTPPSDDKMESLIAAAKKEMEQRIIKMECNAADIVTEKKNKAAIQPDLAEFDKEMAYQRDTKGADIKQSIRVAQFWVDALCPGARKQQNGFRSYCLGKQMEHVNRLLSTNLELMCEDANGVVASEGVDLSCELTENLQVIERGKGISIQKRSEGQRRRTHLAIFLTLFTIAQRRLAFHPSFLFLDEVFDSLDEPGQASVQKWVNSLLTQKRNPIKKVFVITHSHVRVPSSSKGGSGGTLLVTRDPKTGSNYEALDAPNNDDMFVSSHGYRFNKRTNDSSSSSDTASLFGHSSAEEDAPKAKKARTTSSARAKKV